MPPRFPDGIHVLLYDLHVPSLVRLGVKIGPSLVRLASHHTRLIASRTSLQGASRTSERSASRTDTDNIPTTRLRNGPGRIRSCWDRDSRWAGNPTGLTGLRLGQPERLMCVRTWIIPCQTHNGCVSKFRCSSPDCSHPSAIAQEDPNCSILPAPALMAAAIRATVPDRGARF
jgi:hypothetical protein